MEAVCGVDIGGTNTRLVLSNGEGRRLGERRMRTPAGIGQPKLAAFVAREIECLIDEGNHSLVSAVVGVPGTVDPSTGIVRGACHLPDIDGPGFGSHLRTILNVPVVVENDANLALLGELSAGVLAGATTAVMLMIGTGVGAGVLLNGKLLQGRSGLVGEFGSILVSDGSGRVEDVETRRVNRWLPAQFEFPGTATAAAKLGGEDPVAPKDGASRALLTVVTAIALAYEPELIVVGGGAAGSVFSQRSEIEEHLTPLTTSGIRLVPTELGDLVGAIGAAALAAALLSCPDGRSNDRAEADTPMPTQRVGSWPFGRLRPSRSLEAVRTAWGVSK